jgi:rSAM/selenodomain-associated transferase 2
MISIVIPAFNEGSIIRKTVSSIISQGDLVVEVIVSDGGSTDNTIAEATAAGAQVLLSPTKGRAAQMNAGAHLAKGSVLYFLHADSVVPSGFADDIANSVREGTVAGCFRLAFDYDHWFLQMQCWFTRFDIDAFRYGDQSLFVNKTVFERCGGFNESFVVFEDNEIIGRLKKFGPFRILKKAMITSARKYTANGVYKTQFIFYLLYFMYKMKFTQDQLVGTFKNLIRQDKV